MTERPGYPERPAERDRWVVSLRPERPHLDPERPYASLVEEECSASGAVVPVATIFLTNRECPWRCVMCDLWRNTLAETLPAGSIPRQMDFALSQLPPAKQIKLYNSGSFFDPRAIPPQDHPAIAERARQFERTIVECHPALVGEASVRFQQMLGRPLEVAMGLETAHPEVLERLNKRMTLGQFSAAAEFLHTHGIALRVFVLVQPPFLRPEEALLWARRSVEFAFDCGATAVTLIPTRAGNGAMEKLAVMGEFTPPSLAVLEQASLQALAMRRGRVFVDLWDIEKRADLCVHCLDRRIERLHRQNLTQQAAPSVLCDNCGGTS